MGDEVRPLRVESSGGSGRRRGRSRHSGQAATEPSLSEILHLREYWKTIRKRIWTLINFFVILVLSVTVLTVLQDPVYEAMATVQIDAFQSRNYGELQDMNRMGTGQFLSDQEFYATEHTKLRSRTMAKEVMTRLNLWNHEDFAASDDPVDDMLHLVTIAPVDGTRLVRLRCQNTDRELAEALCREWSEFYTENNLSGMQKRLDESVTRLNNQVEAARLDMIQAENSLLEFRKANEVLALSADDQGDLKLKMLTGLTEAMAETEAERVARQAEYQSLLRSVEAESDPLKLGLLVQNELTDELRQDYSTAIRERAELQDKYLEQHPKMVENTIRLSELEAQILGEVQNELARRRSLYELAQAREHKLGQSVTSRSGELLDLGALEAEMQRLSREVETKTSVHHYLLERAQETSVLAQLQVNNVAIVDVAEAKQDPVKPKVAVNISLAVLVGVMGGISLAIFFDYMDNTIKTREEVEALGIPFLGIIPSVPGLEGEGWEKARQRYLYSRNNPKSAFAEFLRNIRTNITYMARAEGRAGQRLLITSAGPREGKTTTSINLGITLAAGGKKVLLVDADMRRPSLHHAFGVDNEKGLSSMILGEATPEECSKQTVQENLSVIGSGPRPPNPAELLGGDGVRSMLDRLDELYDIVIIDSPPVVAVTDAVVLSQRVDGVILVVKSFKVGKDLVEQAKRQLTDVDAHLLGVVLNDFDIQRKSYGYYYYYSYYGSDRTEPDLGSRNAS